MFNINIAGNDDDIFDDEKPLDNRDQKDSSPYDLGDVSKKDFNAAMSSILDVLSEIMQKKDADPQEARNLIRHLKEVHGIKLNNFMAMFRIKLAVTIIEGSGSFISDFQVQKISRAVVHVLDNLCDNNFTLVSRFFDIELENAKRIVVSRFLTDVFLQDMSENAAVFQDLFENNMDLRYVKTYYESLYDINMFTIWQNNGVYAALGKRLDMECNQKVLHAEEVMIGELTSRKYINDKFSKLIESDLKTEIADTVGEYTRKYLEYVKNQGD